MPSTLTAIDCWVLLNCKNASYVDYASYQFYSEMNRENARTAYNQLILKAESSEKSWGKRSRYGLIYHFEPAEWEAIRSELTKYPKFREAIDGKPDNDSVREAHS